MKIALYCQHYGLREMMLHLLSGHNVQQCRITAYGQQDLSDSTEELILSTWPHLDLPLYDGRKPLIIYATNPIRESEIEIFTKIQDHPRCTVVDDQMGKDCYPPETFPVKSDFTIPHSIDPDRYPHYDGQIRAIVMAQNKPFARWRSITEEKLGQDYEWTRLFAHGTPFAFIHAPANQRGLFFQTLVKYRVCFYYSDMPYTLFLYELMAIGMPMVAFDNYRYRDSIRQDPLDRYQVPKSTDPEEINRLVRRFLDSAPATVKYPIRPFREIKAMWEEVIERAGQK